ncbi:hypothetical protein [Arthrobacter sp. S39]|uniref:hypothetical protein n=1 Tax=Arthrobacter sp. S39 TaxID=2509720 RepID=UPI001037D9A3|nr:hypothetical protein [Arthrobacter sp. S39]TAP45202.1 hypothetical protein EYS21_00175 [Arthrobacter sp. S39]
MGKHSSPGPVDGANVNGGAPPGSLVLPDQIVVFVHGTGKALKGGTPQEWGQPRVSRLHRSVDRVGNHVEPPLVTLSTDAVGDASISGSPAPLG